MRKRFFSKGAAVLAVALILTVLAAQAALASEVWKQKFMRFSATAGETLAIGDVVYINDLDGEVYKADANDSTKRPAVGVIGKAGDSGDTVEVVASGVLAGQTAYSAGLRLWLSETAGAFTTTQPTNAQPLGYIMPNTGTLVTSGIYFIKVEMPVSTGAAF